MSKISELKEEVSKWRKSKNGHRGKETPEHIRRRSVELLSEYSAYELQKRLGINVNALRSWQEKYSSEEIFIPLPSGTERPEIISPVNLSLKISRGEWSMEGALSFQEWQNAISLLEGVR